MKVKNFATDECLTRGEGVVIRLVKHTAARSRNSRENIQQSIGSIRFRRQRLVSNPLVHFNLKQQGQWSVSPRHQPRNNHSANLISVAVNYPLEERGGTKTDAKAAENIALPCRRDDAAYVPQDSLAAS